jgi:CRISPR-associated endonuclease/helicase Cas3
MRLPNYKRFFIAATAGNAPFDYQCRVACGDHDNQSEDQWVASGTPSASRLITIPTGCGKTAAVMLAWFWNRISLNNSSWPRRLAYCLPMRTLVEQTAAEVQRWFANLMAKASELELNEITVKKLGWLQVHSPVILMGGEEPAPEKRDWDIHPEHEAILIGTQDMLLSRALNRGYAMSRYRWPMHLGLLNNDCLWVMDETQLMGVGVETSAQLDGFRSSGKLGSIMCPTWWMSATLDTLQLETVDHPRPSVPWPVIALTKHDLEIETVAKRHGASKPLAPAPVTLEPATNAEHF